MRSNGKVWSITGVKPPVDAVRALGNRLTGEVNRLVQSAFRHGAILIVEHLRGLNAVPARGGHFTAVPVKVKGCGTFPVRAFVSVVR